MNTERPEPDKTNQHVNDTATNNPKNDEKRSEMVTLTKGNHLCFWGAEERETKCTKFRKMKKDATVEQGQNGWYLENGVSWMWIRLKDSGKEKNFEELDRNAQIFYCKPPSSGYILCKEENETQGTSDVASAPEDLLFTRYSEKSGSVGMAEKEEEQNQGPITTAKGTCFYFWGPTEKNPHRYHFQRSSDQQRDQNSEIQRDLNAARKNAPKTPFNGGWNMTRDLKMFVWAYLPASGNPDDIDFTSNVDIYLREVPGDDDIGVEGLVCFPQVDSLKHRLKANNGETLDAPMDSEIPEVLAPEPQLDQDAPEPRIEQNNPDVPAPICVVCGNEATGVIYSVLSCNFCARIFDLGLQKPLQLECLNDRTLCKSNASNGCYFCHAIRCYQFGMRKNQ